MVRGQGRLGFWPKGTAAAKGAGEKVEKVAVGKWGRGGMEGERVRGQGLPLDPGASNGA